jgi:3-hydroxybutyryl-CoA dehydrogenase
MNIRNVAVIGAGPTGRRLAALFAGAGFETVLEDILPANLRRAEESLRESSSTVSQAAAIRGKMSFASSVEDAVRFADLVVDCVPDELESKLEIFSMLDRMAPPQTVFVTPTRTLSIADLASCTYRPERCVAVEFAPGELQAGDSLGIVSTSSTSAEVLAAVAEFWRQVGFAVECRLDAQEASVASGTFF